MLSSVGLAKGLEVRGQWALAQDDTRKACGVRPGDEVLVLDEAVERRSRSNGKVREVGGY